MKVYLISNKTGEVLQEFEDAINFANNYVLYSQRGNLGKIYAGENEYFVNKLENDSDNGDTSTK